jgi:hypothetical protein
MENGMKRFLCFFFGHRWHKLPDFEDSPGWQQCKRCGLMWCKIFGYGRL